MNQMPEKSRFQSPTADLAAGLTAFVVELNDRDRAEVMGFVYLASSSCVSADFEVHEDGRFTLTMRGIDPT